MCLIHIRPARSPSPEPMLVPSRPITRGTLPAPPLSPAAYPSPRASRPRHSQTHVPRTPTSPRVSGPVGEPLKRLSIHSREQFEAQQVREREREGSIQPLPPSIAHEQQRQIQSQAPPQSHTIPPTPPAAPSPPSPQRASYERARPPATPTTRSPRTSATRIPPLRRGSDYTYGSAPIPTSPRHSQGRIEAPPLVSPASRDKENIPLVNMTPVTSKAGHRRRESGVSVVNGKDGSLVERERPSVGGGRSSSASLGGGRRLSAGPGGGARRSAGNVGLVGGGEGGAESVWGVNPRGSQRSVRERVVIVEEGRRRREYVRWEG